MVKTQVYIPEDELEELHRLSERTGESVAELIRQAIRRVWLTRREADGPVALWDGEPGRSSIEHDSIYDES